MPVATLRTVPVDIEKIKAIRSKMQISQAEASKRAGFKNHQAWSLIETGRRKNPELETLERIAAVLGVRAKDILK